jgi:hypothetical protein
MTASCGMISTITRESQYAKMYEEKPITLLVMPPINNSTNVEAKDLLYTSISRPLVEAGYYVISPLLAMDVLKAESAYDSELFFDAPLTTFQNYFGADAVVFSIIDTWAKKGTGIETKIRYVIKSAYSNEILFDRSCDLYLDLSIDSGANGLLGALVDLAASAINTAATDHIKAARKANYYILSDIPRGKYSPDYMLDKGIIAEPKDVVTRVK